MSSTEEQGFIAYWEEEGAAYARRGDYAWMAQQLPPAVGRVLEIGCGVGFGTQALIERGYEVIAVDQMPVCLEAVRARVFADGLQVELADVGNLSKETRSSWEVFAPEAVVCWLMGAPQDMTGAVQGDAGRAVAAYRERVHRQVAELASELSSVRCLHYVDRTVIPWQAKDLARDTLLRYHQGKTTLDLPWQAVRGDTLYRRIEIPDADLSELKKSHPALQSAAAALASICLHRAGAKEN